MSERDWLEPGHGQNSGTMRLQIRNVGNGTLKSDARVIQGSIHEGIAIRADQKGPCWTKSRVSLEKGQRVMLWNLVVSLLVFFTVFWGVSLIQKLYAAADKRRMRRSADGVRHTRQGMVNRCNRCGRLYSYSLLFNGTCMYCIEDILRDAGPRESAPQGARSKSGLSVYYSLLECSESDSDAQIKRQYHKKARQVHPDLSGGPGVPESVVEHKTREFQELQDAYNAIIRERACSRNQDKPTS